MVFVGAYPLMMLLRYKFSKIFWKSLFPVLLGGIFLLIQYWFIYQTANESVADKDHSGIGFGLFSLYRKVIGLTSLPLGIVSSLFFPLLYSVLNLKKLKTSTIYLYTVLLLAFSFLVYALIYEVGPRFFHGNFYWQIIPSTWLMFFIVLLSLLKDIKEEGFTTKNKILLAAYTLHVVSGIVYIGRILILHNYY